MASVKQTNRMDRLIEKYKIDFEKLKLGETVTLCKSVPIDIAEDLALCFHSMELEVKAHRLSENRVMVYLNYTWTHENASNGFTVTMEWNKGRWY